MSAYNINSIESIKQFLKNIHNRSLFEFHPDDEFKDYLDDI